MEGFICPICFKDLKTALTLNAHFQVHSLDDQKIFKSVKGKCIVENPLVSLNRFFNFLRVLNNG